MDYYYCMQPHSILNMNGDVYVFEVEVLFDQTPWILVCCLILWYQVEMMFFVAVVYPDAIYYQFLNIASFHINCKEKGLIFKVEISGGCCLLRWHRLPVFKWSLILYWMYMKRVLCVKWGIRWLLFTEMPYPTSIRMKSHSILNVNERVLHVKWRHQTAIYWDAIYYQYLYAVAFTAS